MKHLLLALMCTTLAACGGSGGGGGGNGDTTPPTATSNPPAPNNAPEGTTVTLSGTGSDDGGDPVTFSWTQTGGTTVTINNGNTDTATFTVPNVSSNQALTFDFTVTDSNGNETVVSVTVDITGTQSTPVANAGADQSVADDASVTLDGTTSFDPDVDGSIASYMWSETTATGTTLSSNSASQPTFTANNDGPSAITITFELFVTDNDGSVSATGDTVDIVVAGNAAPTANAGPDQTVADDSTVTLNGSASSDAEGPITYQWSHVSGTNYPLTGDTTASPTFNADNNTPANVTATYQLVVTDNDGVSSVADTVTITVTGNTAPTANAGPDQTVAHDANVTLDGTGSSDSDGSIATYAWTQSAGTMVTLSSNSAAQPTFTANNSGTTDQTLTFDLVVTDDDGVSSVADSVTITVSANAAPTANAGPDQSVADDASVTLTGAGSTDADGTIASYAWVEQGGSTQTLTGANTVSPTFTAQNNGVADIMVTFELTVTDDDGASSVVDTVVITIGGNPAPVANAGADQTVDPGTNVTLSGAASTDDESVASYAWTQTGGPAQTLSGEDTDTLTFTAENSTTSDVVLTFELEVTDNEGATHTDSVTVTVRRNVIISGTLTYDRVPFAGSTSALDYANTTQEPSRRVLMEIRDSGDNTLYSQDFTDNSGAYSLTAPPNTSVFIVVVACSTGADSSATWAMCVQDNTTDETVYVVGFGPNNSGTTDSTGIALNLTSGWNGAGYTPANRIAAPFAIIDSIMDAIDKIVVADAAVVLPPLAINWEDSTADGAFYSPSDVELTLSGVEDADTDEYDRGVIQHEWCHYFNDQLSRADNIGGSHFVGDLTDLRLTFDEGFCNAFAGMVTDDPIYRDSSGANQQGGFAINFENTTFVTNDGYADEIAMGVLAYDLYDATADAGDSAAYGFTPIYNTLVSPALKEHDAFTTIYSFLETLIATAGDAGATATASARDVNSIEGFAAGETKDYGTTGVSPTIYTPLSVGTTANICSSDEHGRYNKLANRRFFKHTAVGTGSKTITITGTSGANNDGDSAVYHKGATIAVGATFGDESYTVDMEDGKVYIIEVYQWEHADINQPANPGVFCFDVELN